MLKSTIPYPILILLISAFCSFVLANGKCAKTFAQETDPKTFKLLKEKMTDAQTGLPKTLDPNLFKGNAKSAYQVAREIPKVLAQMPCFCGCEASGHENLLDCHIDNHAAG